MAISSMLNIIVRDVSYNGGLRHLSPSGLLMGECGRERVNVNHLY